jgi:hypothetical protein
VVNDELEATKEEAQALIDLMGLRGNPLREQFQRRFQELEDSYADRGEWLRMVVVLRDLTVF